MGEFCILRTIHARTQSGKKIVTLFPLTLNQTTQCSVFGVGMVCSILLSKTLTTSVSVPLLLVEDSPLFEDF